MLFTPSVVLAAAILTLAIVPGATTVPTAPWTAETFFHSVPTGVPIYILVTGPPGGGFFVDLYGPPFNGSAPVFSGTYFLGNATGTGPNGTKFAARNVSVPTTILPVEGYELNVKTSGNVHIATAYLRIIETENLTVLSSEIASMNENFTILTDRQLSLFYNQGNLANQYDTLAAVTGAGFAAVAFAIFFTRTGAAEWRLGRRIRTWFWNRFMAPMHLAMTGGWGEAKDIAPIPNEVRIFRGIFFKRCSLCNIDQTEGEIRVHLRAPLPPNGTGHAIKNPMAGVHYAPYRKTIVTSAERRSQEEPDIRKLRESIEGFHVDLSGLGGGK